MCHVVEHVFPVVAPITSNLWPCSMPLTRQPVWEIWVYSVVSIIRTRLSAACGRPDKA
jgi:hypothetical protein